MQPEQFVSGALIALDLLPDRDRVIVVPHGELDIGSTEPVECKVLELCDRGFSEICLDLSELTFFDSSGLRLLLRLDAALSASGCRLSVVSGDGAAARVLALTRMGDRFARSEAARPVSVR